MEIFILDAWKVKNRNYKKKILNCYFWQKEKYHSSLRRSLWISFLPFALRERGERPAEGLTNSWEAREKGKKNWLPPRAKSKRKMNFFLAQSSSLAWLASSIPRDFNEGNSRTKVSKVCHILLFLPFWAFRKMLRLGQPRVQRPGLTLASV